MRAAKTSKAITVPLSIIAALLCIFALKTASSVLIPIVSAVFLYLIFVPVASWMDNAHVPRAISTIAVLLVLTMVLLVVFYVLSMVITSIVTLLPDYYNKFQELDIMITTMLHERFNSEMFSGRSITSILNINWAGMLAGIIAKASNIAISLFLFRRKSTLRRMRELKAMLDEFRRERDEVINMISSKEEQR